MHIFIIPNQHYQNVCSKSQLLNSQHFFHSFQGAQHDNDDRSPSSQVVSAVGRRILLLLRLFLRLGGVPPSQHGSGGGHQVAAETAKQGEEGEAEEAEAVSADSSREAERRNVTTFPVIKSGGR